MRNSSCEIDKTTKKWLKNLLNYKLVAWNVRRSSANKLAKKHNIHRITRFMNFMGIHKVSWPYDPRCVLFSLTLFKWKISNEGRKQDCSIVNLKSTEIFFITRRLTMGETATEDEIKEFCKGKVEYLSREWNCCHL